MDESSDYPSATPLAIALPGRDGEGQFRESVASSGQGGCEGRSTPLRAAANRERFRSLCARTTTADEWRPVHTLRGLPVDPPWILVGGLTGQAP
jgi:hypothetical protein